MLLTDGCCTDGSNSALAAVVERRMRALIGSARTIATDMMLAGRRWSAGRTGVSTALVAHVNARARRRRVQHRHGQAAR
jgi:hypothetical protein